MRSSERGSGVVEVVRTTDPDHEATLPPSVCV
jgi:hypothetical protein